MESIDPHDANTDDDIKVRINSDRKERFKRPLLRDSFSNYRSVSLSSTVAVTGVSSAAAMAAAENGDDARTLAFLDRVGERVRDDDDGSCGKKLRAKAKESCGNVKCRDVANTLFPPMRWIPSYNWRTDLPKDIMGGITICVLLIPQGIAYGQLASLPPIYGLYTAFFAPILYCFFGTSRQLSFGTMAVVTIMTGAIVERVSTKHYVPNSTTTTVTPPLTGSPVTFNVPRVVVDDEARAVSHDGANLHPRGVDDGGLREDPDLVALKVSVVASASLLMGLIQLTLGVFRFGYISSLMSEPLTRAFTTGCACYVFCSELKHFLGIEDPNGIRPAREKGVFGLPWTIYGVFARVTFLTWGSFIIGVSTVVILVAFKSFISPAVKKHLWPSMPMEIPIDIIVVVVATLLSWGFDFQKKFSVAIVGTIPAGFPSPSLPNPKFFVDMIPDCFVLALVGFAISISLGKIVAKRNEYDIEPNVDLMAYGFSNSIGSLFACMPSSGCISRTLLLDSLGVRSQIQGLVSSCVMLLVLMVLGQYFKCLPNSVLAAIIMTAIRKMFLQVTDIPKLWRISKPDCFIWLVTFASTIFLDVPYGLLVGIPFSLLLVVGRSLTPPRVRRLGRVSPTNAFEDVKLYAKAVEIYGVKILRLETSLFYGNAEATKDAVAAEVGIDLVAARRRRRRWSEDEGEGGGGGEEGTRRREERGGENDGRTGDSDTKAILTAEEEGGGEEKIGHVIIDCAAVAFADYVGVLALGQIVKEYNAIGVRVFLANCRPPLVAIIRRTEEAGIAEAILFLSLDDAIDKCRHHD